VRLKHILLERTDTIVACVLLSQLAPNIPKTCDKRFGGISAAKTQGRQGE
jgi:hypothetical protein